MIVMLPYPKSCSALKARLGAGLPAVGPPSWGCYIRTIWMGHITPEQYDTEESYLLRDDMEFNC